MAFAAEEVTNEPPHCLLVISTWASDPTDQGSRSPSNLTKCVLFCSIIAIKKPTGLRDSG